MLPRAQALAASFAGASPLAVSLVKRAVAAAPARLATLLDFEADAQALCFGSGRPPRGGRALPRQAAGRIPLATRSRHA